MEIILENRKKDRYYEWSHIFNNGTSANMTLAMWDGFKRFYIYKIYEYRLKSHIRIHLNFSSEF